MESKKFAYTLVRTSKKVLKPLILALGMRQRDEQILLLNYVEEKCRYDVAEEMGLTYESASNLLCTARKSMHNIMIKDYDGFPEETKKLIDIVLQKC